MQARNASVTSAWRFPLAAPLASIALAPKAGSAGNVVARSVHQWRWSLVALWFTALILLILVRFWDYWSTLI